MGKCTTSGAKTPRIGSRPGRLNLGDKIFRFRCGFEVAELNQHSSAIAQPDAHRESTIGMTSAGPWAYIAAG